MNITVPLLGSVQVAIDTANPGDTITLQVGVSYIGNLTLPVKSGDQYIIIQSSRASELPEDRRVTPSDSAKFARLLSNVSGESVVKTAAGAHHYRFIGIEFSTVDESIAVFDIVRFGESRQTQKTLALVPHHLTIDRCYIHAGRNQDSQRGVSLNCAEGEVLNSYISEIHGVGIEAQAIAAWNGPGPFRIMNNYLEAAGENVMIGGADSAAPELMPADIEIRRNYMFKPLSWKVGDPTYAGNHWTVKNILELKSAKRVVIDGNIFENNWVDAQTGEAILFTVRNQECSAPWSTVEDITFTNNTVKNANGALNFLGKDNEVTAEFGKCNPASSSGQGARALVANNLFYNISGTFMLLNNFHDVTLQNNTHLQGGNTILFFGKEASPGFVYRNNLTIERPFGIRDENGIEGVAALAKWATGYVFIGNVIASPQTPNPPGNQYPTSLTLSADFRSPFAGVGADIDALLAAQGGSTPTPPPVPPPLPTQPTPSPDGTKGNTTTDSLGQVWTLGKKGETLRDGVHMADGFGKEYKFVGGMVYVRWDSTWYRWDGVRWAVQGGEPIGGTNPVPPPVPPIPPATGTRYEHDTSPADVASMNAKGAQGWELVTVVSGLAWFRRVKP